MWDPSSDGQMNKGGGEGQKGETHASYIYSKTRLLIDCIVKNMLQ